jgi:uncharacterized DUF497 family protein
MQFEWDESKNRINKAKHGISFELATKIWFDLQHLLLVDGSFADEERWLAIGTVGSHTLLVAVHTYRGTEDQETVRIISARKATPNEVRRYRSGDDA